MAPTPAAVARLTEKKIGRVLSANRIRRVTASEALAILKRPALTVAPGTTDAAKAHITAVSERVRLVNRQLKEVTRHRVKVDADLVAPDGRLWVSIRDWEDWRFYWPGRYRDVFRMPDNVFVGESIELQAAERRIQLR